MTKERRTEYFRKYWRGREETRKGNYLRFKYGITHADYLKMFEVQKGACAICNTDQVTLKRALAVDHNHETGTVRGLLCFACNTKLAVLEDKQFCAKATLYLQTEVI